jgi:hypothetical protein
MWLDWLKRSIAGRPAEPRTIGFVCVCRDDASLFANARSGSIVRIENRGPPWIVVNHELATAVITSWPVRIWRASVIEAASEADQVSVGGAPKRSAGYTRAIAVEIGEEVPPGELFRPNGAAIASIIDAAAGLTRDEAEALAASRDHNAAAAYAYAWKSWMRAQGAPPEDDCDYDRILSMPGVGTGSPVNRALLYAHDVVFKRASECDGAAATSSDDDDVWLNEPWRTAAQTVLDAIIATGAPGMSETPQDAEILLRAWRRIRP